jgi:hypothetical protein
MGILSAGLLYLLADGRTDMAKLTWTFLQIFVAKTRRRTRKLRYVGTGFRGIGPQANSTAQATAACWRS